MSYTLLIVESPAKCGKIEKFLGSNYKVIGSYGHITHLSNLNQIDFKNNYTPTFNIKLSLSLNINNRTNINPTIRIAVINGFIKNVPLGFIIISLAPSINELIIIGIVIIYYITVIQLL